MDSYRRLYEFVKTSQTTWIPITCSSWLLYPGIGQFCDPASNMVGFLSDFHIIAQQDPPDDDPFPDAWRVFYRHFTGDTSGLPQDTSLQRRLTRWLSLGNKVGGGTGILLFDGEKILNK